MCGLMREVPNPLIIDISKGRADINLVRKDILALTKLNYNTCIFGDGMPITLNFADAGRTARPLGDSTSTIHGKSSSKCVTAITIEPGDSIH